MPRGCGDGTLPRMTSGVEFNSWDDPRVDDGDGRASRHDDADEPGFGDSAHSFVAPPPDLTASDAVVMPDPFAALELDAASVPIAEPVPEDQPDGGPPDPEADFYDLIL
jgi:hypothetical protein